MPLYAHTPPPDDPDGEWHLLSEHLRAVANMASEHADAFGAAEIAWWAGILHDAGKASDEFQRYLRLCHEQPSRKHKSCDHKGAGAVRAQALAGPLAYPIQGHHGGLPGTGELSVKRNEWRLDDRALQIEKTLQKFDGLNLTDSSRTSEIPTFATSSALASETFLRMLFSALVDADHFDTERHFTPAESNLRGTTPDLAMLWHRFQADQAELIAAAETHLSPVNDVRREVYDACLRAAELPPGFFRLTVPTGGGKTRSSLAFALAHALRHRLRRVIYAVPFLTITDQTAAVFRSALGDDRAVLEHHSGVDLRDDPAGAPTFEETWRRLAAQDWDAPIIVTTTVQLFESLFGRTPTACRKLHRIAGSVIVLDEAQTLPPHLRKPIFDMLRELVANYRVSVVLCTATQPALDTLERELGPAFCVTEIAPEPQRLFRALERVRYEWPVQDEQWTWERAADELRTSEQALAVLNTIGDALALYEAVGDPEAFHLSTLMCGVHRRDVLAIVRRRLASGEPCRLVSTQVVEAGVDIDFPLVLRALGPLDRIAQAAGRCNREGKMSGLGRVVIFAPVDGKTPTGAYRTGTGETLVFLREGEIDLHDPEIFVRYFKRLFAILPPDREGIQPLRAALEFEEVASRFKLIDDDTVSLIVRYRGMGDDHIHKDRVEALITEFSLARTRPGSGRGLLRRSQPYIVSVSRRKLSTYVADGMAVELVADAVYEWVGAYDERRGLADERLDPALLYVG